MNPFDNVFGDPSANTTLAKADLRRVARRAHRLAQRGVQPAGVAGMRARAADQAELAREIGEALQGRDVVHAQALIAEGERLFGRLRWWTRWSCRRARTIKTGWPSITRRPLYAAELFRGRFRRGGDASGIAPFRWEEIGAVLTLTVQACRGNTSEL